MLRKGSSRRLLGHSKKRRRRKNSLFGRGQPVSLFNVAARGEVEDLIEFCEEHDHETPLDFNAFDVKKMTALMHAVSQDHLQSAKYLLENGALANVPTEVTTALHLACREGFGEHVEMLISHGALLTKRNPDGSSVLHLACQKGHTEVARVLLLALSDPAFLDSQTRTGQTALHYAVLSGKLKLMKLLLKYGASTRIRNSQHKLARELGLGNDKIQSLFSKYQKLRESQTPFALAQSVSRTHDIEVGDDPFERSENPNDEVLRRYLMFGKPDFTYWQLYDKAFMADCEISINGYIFVNGHQAILSRIPYFEKILSEWFEMDEDDRDPEGLRFKEVGLEEDETVQFMMRWVYGERIDISKCPSSELNLAWRMAKEWGIPEFADAVISGFHRMPVSSALAVMAGVRDPNKEYFDDDEEYDEIEETPDLVPMDEFMEECVKYATKNGSEFLDIKFASDRQALQDKNETLYRRVMRAAANPSSPMIEAEEEGEGTATADIVVGVSDHRMSSLQQLKTHLSDLLVNNKWTDMVLRSAADAHEFRIHKVVLGRYVMFRDQLERLQKRGIGGRLHLSLGTPYIRFLLQYLYATDLVTPSIRVLVGMSVVADAFRLGGLEQLCYSRIMGLLTDENIFSVIEMCASFIGRKKGLAKMLLRFWNTKDGQVIETLQRENMKLKRQNERLQRSTNLLNSRVQQQSGWENVFLISTTTFRIFETRLGSALGLMGKKGLGWWGKKEKQGSSTKKGN